MADELLERIDQLEREIGDVRGMVGDQLAQSGGQTIDSAGRIAYEFEGHVHAAGLDLDASVTGADQDRQVRWLRESDGAVCARVVGQTAAGPPASGTAALVGDAPGAATVAQLFATGRDDGTAEAMVSAGAEVRTLLDELGASSFLQLDAADDLRLSRGSLNVHFTGASTDSDAHVIAHGLGRAPALVLAAAIVAPNHSDIPAYNSFNYTPAQFSMNARRPTGASGDRNVGTVWVAIG